MQNHNLENPYKEVDDDEEDDDLDTLSGSGSWAGPNGFNSGFSQSRNGSSSSLRSRSTTGDSTLGSISETSATRGLPPRIPTAIMPQGLSLRTRELQALAQSPGSERAMDSYFSPTTDSPMSSLSARTSASSGIYPFPRQGLPQNGYYEEGHGATRFTAPAMARQPMNGSSTPNGYTPTSRVPSGQQRYPPGTAMHSSMQLPPSRNRSASSPDIHNGQRVPLRNGNQPPVPEMPASYANRSQNNSPGLPNGLDRTSPQLLRDGQFDASPTDYAHPGRPGITTQYASTRTITPASSRVPYPPPTPSSFAASEDGAPHKTTPAQLKVRVHCPAAGQTLTLVVSTTISYQTLKDRIDAKLQRSTNLSLGDRGPKEAHVKLKYLDEDDFVSIQSDEDVQTAFETWKEQHGEGIGGMGEIELYCQR